MRPNIFGNQKYIPANMPKIEATPITRFLLKRRLDRIFTHPALRGGYELTRVHGIDVDHAATEDVSGRKVFADAVVADFAIGRDASHAVLTVYRPYPYSSGPGAWHLGARRHMCYP